MGRSCSTAVGSSITEREDDDIRIMLFGVPGSGKSTVLKQLRSLFGGGFSPEEIATYRTAIRNEVLECLKTFIRKTVMIGNYSYDSPQCRLLEDLETLDEWCPKVTQIVAALWQDPENRRRLIEHRCQQPFDDGWRIDSAEYFFDNVVRIGADDYQPTTLDIIHARAKAGALVEEAVFEYNRKRIHVFDLDTVPENQWQDWFAASDCFTVVLICVNLDDHHFLLRADNKRNQLKESLILFANLYNCSRSRLEFVLFFNKTDHFNVETHVCLSLSATFPEYKGGSELAEIQQFLINTWLSVRDPQLPHQTYCHFTCATDAENMKRVLTEVLTTADQNSSRRDGMNPKQKK